MTRDERAVLGRARIEDLLETMPEGLRERMRALGAWRPVLEFVADAVIVRGLVDGWGWQRIAAYRFTECGEPDLEQPIAVFDFRADDDVARRAALEETWRAIKHELERKAQDGGPT